MIKITSLSVAGAFLACGLSAAPAAALSNRTFVSGKGTDSGTCPVSAPCRSFAFALSQTAAGGEIDVLDSAGYGLVTITKSISIVNDGAGVAGIRPGPGLNGVTINAGATDDVHLRGLTIDGFGSGQFGIQFISGVNLAIENCVIRNFAFSGIKISPGTESSFSVSNTIASNNVDTGISVRPTGTGSVAVSGVLRKVITNNNGNGIIVSGAAMSGTSSSLNVAIVDSEASNNSSIGVGAFSSPGHTATTVMVRNVVASNNGFGLDAGTNATLRVAHSVVTGNIFGVFVDGGGIINSYGDNDIDGNTDNNFAALTTLAEH